MDARPANDGQPWTREQLILAFELYCRIPFQRTKASDPRVMELAAILHRTPASVARKLGNFGAFDPQGRMTKVVNRTWYNGAQLDELARFDYERDGVGSPTRRWGNRNGSAPYEGFSKIQKMPSYQYDGLHRLITAEYDVGGAQTKDEHYVYDELGNRAIYRDERNSITTAYANNAVNEYVSVGSHLAFHDAAGNLTRMNYEIDGGTTKRYEYGYDYENRLTLAQAKDGTSTVELAAYEYDALGRMISARSRFDSDGDADSATSKYYYDGQNVLAEYEPTGDDVQRRYVHGSQYIDERMILIEGDPASGDAAIAPDTFYYLLEDLYTVTGLMKRNGILAEAHDYDGYGKVKIWAYSDGDLDRDGDVDNTDQTLYNAVVCFCVDPTTDPTTDLNMDGATNGSDTTIFTAIKNGGGVVEEIFVSGLGNRFYFTGRDLFLVETDALSDDPVTAADKPLQNNRARFYDPDAGRWMQRDPAEYVDGMNFYEMVRSNLLTYVDPFGLLFQVRPPWAPPPRPRPGDLHGPGTRVTGVSGHG